MPKGHNTAEALEMFVERKEVSHHCMRGYLKTQLPGEDKPRFACYVLEKPPDDNAPYISSIPQGQYSVRVRTDHNKGWRLELSGVPDREGVEIHIGNFPKDTTGCLLPGMKAPAHECAVLDSEDAMTLLRGLFSVFGDDGVTTITISGVA